MADEGGPPVWGLWNDALGEWFNPGTAKPYFRTREEAQHRLPLVLRQYPYGKWQIKEYPVQEEEESQPPAEPGRSGLAP